MALRCQKALEKQFDKAQRQSTAASRKAIGAPPEATAPATQSQSDSEDEGQEFFSDASLASVGSPRSSMGDSADLFHCLLEAKEDSLPVMPLAPQRPLPQPTKQTRPVEDQGPALSQEMQEVIAKAISQGIAEGLNNIQSVLTSLAPVGSLGDWLESYETGQSDSLYIHSRMP